MDTLNVWGESALNDDDDDAGDNDSSSAWVLCIAHATATSTRTAACSTGLKSSLINVLAIVAATNMSPRIQGILNECFATLEMTPIKLERMSFTRFMAIYFVLEKFRAAYPAIVGAMIKGAYNELSRAHVIKPVTEAELAMIDSLLKIMKPAVHVMEFWQGGHSYIAAPHMVARLCALRKSLVVTAEARETVYAPAVVTFVDRWIVELDKRVFGHLSVPESPLVQAAAVDPRYAGRMLEYVLPGKPESERTQFMQRVWKILGEWGAVFSVHQFNSKPPSVEGAVEARDEDADLPAFAVGVQAASSAPAGDMQSAATEEDAAKMGAEQVAALCVPLCRAKGEFPPPSFVVAAAAADAAEAADAANAGQPAPKKTKKLLSELNAPLRQFYNDPARKFTPFQTQFVRMILSVQPASTEPERIFKDVGLIKKLIQHQLSDDKVYYMTMVRHLFKGASVDVKKAIYDRIAGLIESPEARLGHF